MEESGIPDYILNPEMDMPENEVNGQRYIGVLRIPALSQGDEVTCTIGGQDDINYSDKMIQDQTKNWPVSRHSSTEIGRFLYMYASRICIFYRYSTWNPFS